MISKDWLRHSTVDRRTLRPLSMVHFDPCQRPCCPVSTSTSVQQTCNTQMSRKTYQAAALQRNMASCTRPQETTCKQTAKQGRGNQRWGEKNQLSSRWILNDNPSNLHDTSSLHTPWSTPPTLSSDPSSHPLQCLCGGWNVQPLCFLLFPQDRWDLLIMEYLWRDCRLTLNITLLSHCVASS